MDQNNDEKVQLSNILNLVNEITQQQPRSFAAAASIGKRKTMEDEYFIEKLNDNIDFCAVLDGHGGNKAAKHFKEVIPQKFREQFDENMSEDDIRNLIIKIFLDIDGEWFRIQNTPDPNDEYACWGHIGDQSGTTFAGVVITKNRIITINLGDSRAIISKFGKLVFETNDHKALDDKERELAIKRGGKVALAGPISNQIPARIGSGWGIALAVTRALGDIELKTKYNANHKSEGYLGENSILSPVPEIFFHYLNQGESMQIVLGTDGIFDVLSSESVAHYVNQLNYKNCDDVVNLIANGLVSCSQGSSDNRTVVLVNL